MAKGGSKALTGILCFIFGFLFAIIVEVAAIAAGIYFLLNADIDGIFSLAGIDNTDEDGKNIYINTNVDEGGVKKVTDLVAALRDLAGKGSANLTIGDFEKLFPIADSGVDYVYTSLASALSGYNITEDDLREIIDEEELKQTPFSELGSFFAECGDKVQVSTLLKIASVDIESNALYLTAAYGAEAAVIYDADGDIVLYKDSFTLKEGVYVRSGDEAVLPAEFESYLVERGNGVDFDLYYAVEDAARANAAYIAQSVEEGFVSTSVNYTLYSAQTARISGGYYYNSADELVVLHSRTLGEIKDGENGVLSALDDVYVTDVIGKADDEVLNSVLGGVTLGDLLNGKVSFEDKLDSVYVPAVIDVTLDDAIMMYVGYSLVDVTPAEGQAYDYTATLLSYEQDENGAWVVAGSRQCFVEAEEGKVSRVYYMEDGKETEYKGVAISKIGTQTANITKALKVKDVIEIEEGDRLMEKLGEYTIADIGSAIDELYLSDFLDDIFTEDSLMAYMVYGISNIQPVAEGQVVPEGVTHTATYHISETETVQVYVVTDSQTAGEVTDYIITRVYYFVEEAETECFTTINGVNDRINGLMNDLTLGEIISITEEDGDILNALSGSTINSLSSDLNALTLQELFTDAVYGEDAQLVQVTEQTYSADYIYYEKIDGEFVLVNAGEENQGKLFGEWQESYAQYYTYGASEGVWSLLLYNENGEKVYGINDVSVITENVVYNLGTCTLNRFAQLGVIEMESSQATLEMKLSNFTEIGGVSTGYEPPVGKTCVGDLTMSEFIELIGAIGSVGQS